jgi:hypothetical protein
MQIKHYMIQARGFLYAVDEYATSKREALAQFKKRWKLSRMPNGYGIWEA